MKLDFFKMAGLEISTRPLAQESVKTTWASTNPRVFDAFIKGTRQMARAVKIEFPSPKWHTHSKQTNKRTT